MVGARGSTILWWELGGPLYYGGSQGVHCIMVGVRGSTVLWWELGGPLYYGGS